MRKHMKRGLKIIGFILLFFGFSYFILKEIDIGAVLGSLGIFKFVLIPVLSIFGSNILTASFLYPTLFSLHQSGMNLILLSVLSAIGGTLGDLLFVYFGKNLNSSKRSDKVIKFFEKNQDSPFLRGFIFLYAGFFPMSNELMTLALGYLKYPMKKTWLPLGLGNIVYYLILISFGSGIFKLLF